MKNNLIYLNIIISSFLLSQDLGSMLNKANNKLKAGELKLAEIELQKILEIDPLEMVKNIFSLSIIWSFICIMIYYLYINNINNI